MFAKPPANTSAPRTRPPPQTFECFKLILYTLTHVCEYVFQVQTCAAKWDYRGLGALYRSLNGAPLLTPPNPSRPYPQTQEGGKHTDNHNVNLGLKCDRFRGLASARWQLLLGSCFSNRSPLAKVRVGVSLRRCSSARQLSRSRVQSP